MATKQVTNYLRIGLIILVLGISVFTHFYRIDQTYIFQNDEGRDALIAYKMIDTRRPILLGPETSVGNMYLGPLYYYLITPALLATNLDPVGPAMMIGLLGVLTTGLLIIIGRRMWGIHIGLIAGLFYALSPVMVHYSRSSWNPNAVPFFATLLLLLYPYRTTLARAGFGILTGILFQLHYVALIMPGLLFLKEVRVLAINKAWRDASRYLATIILGFLLSSAPFWLFEVRHDWVNTQAFFNYLTEKGSEESVGSPGYLERLIINTESVVSGVVASKSVMKPAVSSVGIILAYLVIIMLTLTRFNHLSYLLIGTIIVVSLLRERVYVHYISHLFPVISLMIASAFARPGLIRGTVIALSLLLISPTISSLRYNLFELTSIQPKRAREVAEYINREAAGRPYNVVNTQGSYTTTISYFLAISDNPPRNDLQKLVFDICVGAPCPADDETTVLLFLTGPAHPSIGEYLGHPQINEFSVPRQMTSNAWVTYDVHVATIEIFEGDRIEQ